MGAYLKTGRSDSAHYFAQQLTEALTLTPFPPPEPSVHLLLARYFEEVGLLPQSIRHFNNYTNQTDSIHKAHQSIFTQIIELENQLENEHLRQQVLNSRLDQQSNRQWAYGVAALVLALLLAVAVAVALRFRQLKRRLARSLNQEGHTRAELQRTNAQLLEMTHFRELLLGTIVHDLKTPLNSILGLAMLPPSERNLELIFQSGKRMLAQVHDLLDVQRLEQAQLNLNVQSCRVDELLEQAVAEVLFEAQQRRIDIAIGGLPDRAIVCDSGLLVRVLVNLLTNAIKFSPHGGTLEVKAMEVPEGLGFQVLDQGPGIPDHQRQLIFEPYSRVQGKSLGKARSTGLGLTFCKLAVEAHGGRIGVENRPTGGACFSVVLPQPTGTLVAAPSTHRFMDAEPA
jgi:signal transduction histidine kinase